MPIKNEKLRKLKAKRLYLSGYSLLEIMQITGSSLFELDRWRLEEGWDEELPKKTKKRSRGEGHE